MKLLSASPYRDEALLQRPDEVVVLDVAERTSYRSTVLAEEVETAARIQNGSTAMLARQTLRTARHRGKDVVRVHGADDEATAGPRRATRETLQASLQTAHADGVQVQQLAVKHHLWRRGNN